ncbi:MAG: alpha/beta hydrolase [Alphaproteobacteria bacterium]|nr:alpha/beta hydrolase [Alphaproteobacteria bacterium]
MAIMVFAFGCTSNPAGAAPAPPPDQSYYMAVEAPGQGTVHIYAEEFGQGRPILLLHGLGASMFTWRNLIGELSRHNRVIAIDMKGFGKSEKPFTQAYTPYDHANVVLAFIRKRGIENATIIGHSFGGAIGLLATLRLNETNPTAVRELILMNAPAYEQPGTDFVRFMKSPILPYAALMLVPPELSTWLSLDKVQADRLSFEELRGYAEPFYEAAARHALITTARRIELHDVERLTSRYPSVRQRTLVIWCDADHTVPIETGLKLVKALPRARMKVLSGCGHVPQDERPEAVLELISSFLRR